jgi:hypothetical protein
MRKGLTLLESYRVTENGELSTKLKRLSIIVGRGARVANITA